MDQIRMQRIAAPCLLFVLLGVSHRDAVADAILSGAASSQLGSDGNYTVQDLGSTASLSTDANGNRVVVSSDGTRYAFPGSAAQSWSPGSLAQAGAPLPAYNSGPNDLSPQSLYPLGGLSNQAGTFVASASIVPRNNDIDYSSELFTFSRLANGSFSHATVFLSQSENAGFTGWPLTPMLLNNSNMVLTSVQPGSGAAYEVYNVNTGQISAIFKTGGLVSLGYSFIGPIAMDDQGRILMVGNILGQDDKVISDGVTFLLTPAGLTSNPIPTPEPTTLVTLGVASIGLLIHRRRRR